MEEKHGTIMVKMDQGMYGSALKDKKKGVIGCDSGHVDEEKIKEAYQMEAGCPRIGSAKGMQGKAIHGVGREYRND